MSRRNPPPSSFQREYVDPEGLESYQERGLRRSQSLQSRVFGSPSDGAVSSLQRANTEVRDTLLLALKRSSSITQQLSGQLSGARSKSAQEILTALQRTASGDFREASAQVESVWRRFERGFLAHAIARTLVCLFFMDRCLAKYKNWQFYQSDFWQQRIAMYPHRYRDPAYPYFELLIILPCAVLAVLGIRTRVAAGVLVLDMLRDSLGIIWRGMRRVVQHKIEPDELTAKHLAMLGSAVLVLAHAVRDRYSTSNTVAGLLMGDSDRVPGRFKSIVLLFSRLALTLLFLTVGISQARRVIRRDWNMFAKHQFLRQDGHDNNFLLVEAILAVPFAVGYRTRLISPLLALTLLAEAVFCWWPLEPWPSVQYQAHVRNHFVTNLGAAGGLLLLQTYGAGRYAVDGLMKTKKGL